MPRTAGPCAKRKKDEFDAGHAIGLDPSLNAPSRILAAFALPMDCRSVPRFAEPGVGGTEPSGVARTNMEMTPDFPQVAFNYPGTAGQFMNGVPMNQGAATGNAQCLSTVLTTHMCNRLIQEWKNSKGQPAPYSWYDQGGSRDFSIACGAGATTSGITEELVPCYAAYNENLVAPGDSISPSTVSDSIWQANSLLINTQEFVNPPIAAHGILGGKGVIPTGTYKDKQYIWHDGGNFPDSHAVTVTAVGPGTTSTTADGWTSGVIWVSWGADNVNNMQPNISFELWAYNEGAPYRVSNALYKAGAAIPSTATDHMLVAFQVPYPDYYRIICSAVDVATPGGALPADTLNLRVNQISASLMFRHLTNPRLHVIWESVQAHRGYGSAARVHNGTVGEYPGGDYACWQPSIGAEWQSMFDGGVSPFDFVNQKNLDVQESIELKKGAYFWIKPQTLQQMIYLKDIRPLTAPGSASVNGAPGLPCALNFQLNERLFAAGIANVPVNTNIAVPTQSLKIYWGFTDQWTTGEQYFPQAEGDYTQAEWKEAMNMARSTCQLTPNETHLQRIGAIFRNVGRWGGEQYEKYKPLGEKLLQWAPKVLDVASKLAPLLA